MIWEATKHRLHQTSCTPDIVYTRHGWHQGSCTSSRVHTRQSLHETRFTPDRKRQFSRMAFPKRGVLKAEAATVTHENLVTVPHGPKQTETHVSKNQAAERQMTLITDKSQTCKENFQPSGMTSGMTEDIHSAKRSSTTSERTKFVHETALTQNGCNCLETMILWHDMTGFDMIWYGMMWYVKKVMIWHDVIWYHRMWYEMKWNDMIGWLDVDILMMMWEKGCEEKERKMRQKKSRE